MEVKAKLRHYHLAPRKVRLVLNVIRGLNVEPALRQLQFLNKKSSPAIIKLLNSAIANGVNNFSLDKDNLFVKTAFADQGPAIKRWRPRAHGRAAQIKKLTSHITLVLDERIPSQKPKKKLDKKSTDQKIIKTKKVKFKNIKKNKDINKEFTEKGVKKPMIKQSKSPKSFIRKTGEK